MGNTSQNDMLSAAAGLVSPKNLETAVIEIAGPAAGTPALETAPVISDPNKGISDPKLQNVQPSAVQPPVAPSLVNPLTPIVVKSPLGDMTYGGIPIDQVKLSSFADVAAFAKDVVGAELKDVQDFVGFISDYKVVKEKANEVENLQKMVDAYKTSIDGLPKDVSLILSAALQGQDHMPILQKLTQKAVIDFDKSFISHDSLAIINHYTEKNFTKETFDALDPSVQENFQDIAKLKYKADQDEYNNMQANIKSVAETRQKNFLASVDTSIAKMVTNNPKMDKGSIERVRQIMTGGLTNSLFAQDRVSYLPDAAEKIAYLEFGKVIVAEQAKTIGDIVAKIRAEGESDATAKLILRSDKPIPAGGTGNIDKNIFQTAIEQATRFLKAR
jgi:hypothetical protein